MYKLTKTTIIHIAVLIFLAVLMLLFAFLDLDIAKAIYNPNSFFGKFFRVVGDITMMCFLPLLSAALLVFFKRAEKSRVLLIILLIVLLGCSFFLSLQFFKYFGLQSPIEYTLIAVFTPVFALLAYLAFFKLKSSTLIKWLYILIIAAVFAAISNAFVQIIKIVWGRTRFYSLETPDYRGFSPWYIPQGITGNKSFPSGHTCSACGLLITPLICKTFKLKLPLQIILNLFSVAFIVSTAISRMLLGAHYASDTTFSVIICYSALILTKHLLDKKFFKRQRGTEG